MGIPLAILMIEDTESDAQLTVRTLRKVGYEITFQQIETAAQMRAALEKQTWDIVISDYSLPQFNGPAALRLLQEMGLDIPFITVSGTIGEETAVDMMKAGAHDYLMKGNLARLASAIERELAQAKVRRERKQAEEALAASESELRALFASMHDAVLVIDYEGVYRKIAPTQPINVYKPPEELLGKSLAEIFPEEQAQLFLTALRQVLATGQTTQIEYQLNFDGRTPWFETAISPLTTDSTLWVARDITERKQAEKAVELSHKRFQSLIENSADAITLLDADGIAIYDSPAAPGMLGYGPDELIGQNVFTLIHPDDLPNVQDLFQNLLKTPDTRVNGTFRLRHKNGMWRWMEGVATNLLNEPSVNAIVTNYRDVSERKEAENALRNSEAEFRALFAAMNDVVIVYDSQGRYLSIAPTNASLLYKPPTDLIGKTMHEVLPAFQANLIIEHIHRALDTKHTVNLDYSLTLGEREVWFAASISPSINNTVILVAHDITERKRAEEKIQQQIERLTALSLIDQAISASFDLRLVLNILLEQVTTQLRVDAAAVLLHHTNLHTLEFSAGRGFRSNAYNRTQVRLGDGQAGKAALERQIVAHPDFAVSQPIFVMPEVMAGEGFAAYYAVPLIAKGQVKGVLEVFHRAPHHADEEWLRFLNTLAGQAAIAIDNAELFNNLHRSNADLMRAYDATIEGWSHALDLRDKETEGHTQRVTEMTLTLAQAMGQQGEPLMHIHRGALLHDMGKLGVPDDILHKPAALTDDEWVVMKKHPQFAYDMFAPIDYLRRALDIPYCHHEKWDGSGYPRGLKGEDIPLAARIFAIVDVWDALRSDRPYRQGWSEAKVREHIRANSGTHFDPQVVEAFMRMLEEK
ncbi:MAG: PAS domain S-box protein [Chloroflexi bacterium]|nr:PAS domain S-box protein [Chloroflexota bacterium]